MGDQLKVFRDALGELEGWRQRQIQNPPEQPESGSDLAEDDKAFPHSLISEVARTSLVSAGEHLRLVWDGLDRGNLYGTSQYSAVRGAVVGAAQAVWILTPDDRAERRRRGYQVIADSYEQLRKFHQRHLDLADLLGLTADEQDQVRDQISWITGRRERLRGLQPDGAKLNMTTVLEFAAPYIFPRDPRRQADLRLSWNVLSADAHVLTWALATRAEFPSFIRPDRVTGLSVGVASDNALPRLVNYFDLAMRGLRCGWNQFDRRCEGP